MFRKEVKRLVSFGVLEESNDSKWVTLSFAQPKAKANHVRLLSGFRKLDRQLNLKPYPMPLNMLNAIKLIWFSICHITGLKYRILSHIPQKIG